MTKCEKRQISDPEKSHFAISAAIIQYDVPYIIFHSSFQNGACLYCSCSGSWDIAHFRRALCMDFIVCFCSKWKHTIKMNNTIHITHARMHAHTLAHSRTHTRTHTHTSMHARTRTHTHVCNKMGKSPNLGNFGLTPPHTHTPMQARTHTCKRTRINTWTTLYTICSVLSDVFGLNSLKKAKFPR